jgi:hypothetical protein
MNSSNILAESTLKLKKNTLIFSGVSLFIGLTKSLPTKINLIGLDLTSNPKTLGWFIFYITLVLFFHYFFVLTLDYLIYFKKNILSKKGKKLTGDTLLLTLDDITDAYNNNRTEYNQQEERAGTLEQEQVDINRKFKVLENDFDVKHLNFTNCIEFLFNALLPIFLALVGLRYLYHFLNI